MGHMGGLINTRLWRKPCQASYSNTVWPPLPRKRAPCQRSFEIVSITCCQGALAGLVANEVYFLFITFLAEYQLFGQPGRLEFSALMSRALFFSKVGSKLIFLVIEEEFKIETNIVLLRISNAHTVR